MKKKDIAAMTAEESAENKTAEQEGTAAQAEEKKAEGLVWCGPSLRDIARQYTVYAKEVPEALQAFIKAHPAAKNLLVGTEQFAQTRIKIETPGTAESILYNKIKKEI